MTTKFEIGKKYTYSYNEIIYTCVGFSLSGSAILQKSPTNTEFILVYPFTTLPHQNNWKEYKEPATRTWWVNMYKHTRENTIVAGGMHPSKKQAEMASDLLIGESQIFLETVEFTYTEKANA